MGAVLASVATQPSIEVVQARTLLAAYLAHSGNTGMGLSRVSGVPQYTISKFLTGRIKSLTPHVQLALQYANIGISAGISKLTADPRIQRALGSAWDGTDQGVTLLASAIDALAPRVELTQPAAAPDACPENLPSATHHSATL
eukprot:gene10685-13558_t